MPGRTPPEAVSAFLEPLKVLDSAAHIGVNPKGGYRTGVRYTWVLNGAQGMPLGPAGTCYAEMAFEIVETNPATNEYGHPPRVRR